MLGDGDRDYLLVFQNNAEIRATGGLPGAVRVVEADDGKVDARPVRTRRITSAQRTPPTLPMTEAERASTTGISAGYFLNAGMTPDFPRAAELIEGPVGAASTTSGSTA